MPPRLPVHIAHAIARYHRAAALILFNTLLAILALNIALYVPFRTTALCGTASAPVSPALPGSEVYEAGVRKAVQEGAFRRMEQFYPEFTPEQVAALMLETWLLRPYVYEPFTQFAERPYPGRFVNVDVNGFRRSKDQGPWPPDARKVNVFLFGGSTTFGYGVPDDQTIASYLQDLLSTAGLGGGFGVYNFGRGYYFSTQERVLFEKLIGAGFQPDLAVFIDGLNDFYNTAGEPEFTSRLRMFLARAPERPVSPYVTIACALPMGKAALWLKQRAAQLLGEERSAHAADPAGWDARPGPQVSGDEALIQEVIARFVRNKRMIDAVADAHGVRSVFVWQPVPTYKYEPKYHPSTEKGLGPHEHSRLGYPAMAKIAMTGELGRNFLWCADVQESAPEPVYIDRVHYTPQMARRVARCIVEGMISRGLITGKKAS